MDSTWTQESWCITSADGFPFFLYECCDAQKNLKQTDETRTGSDVARQLALTCCEELAFKGNFKLKLFSTFTLMVSYSEFPLKVGVGGWEGKPNA